jgi:chromosome segregation ATPase
MVSKLEDLENQVRDLEFAMENARLTIDSTNTYNEFLQETVDMQSKKIATLEAKLEHAGTMVNSWIPWLVKPASKNRN